MMMTSETLVWVFAAIFVFVVIGGAMCGDAKPAVADPTAARDPGAPVAAAAPAPVRAERCGGIGCSIPIAEATEPVTGSEACNGAPAAGWDDVQFCSRTCAFNTMMARGRRV